MALTNKLSSIGDAIRAKTGKSGLLTLDEMPTEIASISGGGGGGGGDDYLTWYNNLCNSTEDQTEWSIDFDAEYIPAFSNYYGPHPITRLKLTKCNLPNLKKVVDNAFRLETTNTKTIDRIELPEVTEVGANSFSIWMTTLSLPKCTKVTNFVSSHIYNYYLPKVTSLPNQAFNNSSVKAVMLTDYLTAIGATTANNSPFRSSASIEKLILWTPDAFYDATTGTTSGLPTLNTYLTNYAHNNASNRFYNGSAKIYVPRAALSAYQNATNWSVYYAAGNIVAIEDNEAALKGIFQELDSLMGWS